jgi:hypothetical protein
MIKSFHVCAARFDLMDRFRFNGALGSMWHVYIFWKGAWLFAAQGFVSGHRPTRTKVIEIFDDNPAVYAAMKPVGDEHDI